MRISDWSSDVCSSDLCERCGRTQRKDVGPFVDGRVELIGRNDLVDEAHFKRFLPAILEIEIPDFAGLLVADMAREDGGTPTRVHRTALRADLAGFRSEQRRVGQACVRTYKYRWD